MDLKAKTLAKKYAVAFLNCFGQKLSIDDSINIQHIGRNLEEQPYLITLLKLPTISKNIKHNIAKDIIKNFNLPSFLQQLCDLLIEHQRLFLMSKVFEYIGKVYNQRNNIDTFAIRSSHTLDEKQIDIIKKFLAEQTGHRIMYTYGIDKELIAGLRLQSDTLLWQYSIQERLNNVKKLFL